MIKLLRYAYMENWTAGRLYVDGKVFYTLERAWIPSHEHLGGTNFISCVPDGIYSLKPYSSKKHPDVWRLTNEMLDVYGDRINEPGRWDILMHIANKPTELAGCIAVGLNRDQDGSRVWKSGAAVEILRGMLLGREYDMEIRPMGAANE